MNKEITFKAKVIKNRYNSEDFKIYVVDVDDNIYKNIKTNKNKEYIIVGNTPNLIPDIEYSITATEEINKSFGYQYKVKNIRRDKPTDYNTSMNFFKEIITEKQAKTLLDVYPNIIDKVIKNDLDDVDLNKTKGIKEKTFNSIKNKIISNFCLIELVDTFGGLIDMNTIKKLYDTYGTTEAVKRELRKDPYKCLCKLSRVGFKTADSVLLNLQENNKLHPDKFKFSFDYELKFSEERMKACLVYMLEQNESEGNTLMMLKNARKECGKLVPECLDKFVTVIKNSKEDIHVDLENKTVSTQSAYESEMKIKYLVDEMVYNDCYKQWNSNYELYREVEGFAMTDEQLKTLDMMCNNNIGLLTAPAGSGKSMSVKALLNMLDDLHKTYTLMTPTGASSKVLSEYTKRECGTIHRQLKYNPSNKENKWGYNNSNKLDVDIIIIDEFSMVDIYLMSHVLDAVDIKKTKLLFVFDPFQLPSVGCGNIAQNLLSSNIVPTVFLSKIFRYNEGGLMEVATKIRNSERFVENGFKGNKVFGTNKDFIFCGLDDNKIPKQVLGIYNKMLNDGYDIEDIMILSSQNKGDYGTKNINKIIQSFLQKKRKTKFIMRGDTKFHEGDKIIQTVNNYKAITINEEETSIFNGNTGIIVKVWFDSIDINFDGTIVHYTKQELLQIELGYCISIHKSQGSSAKQVIVISPKAHTFMLNSNLLYVAVTRAKERVYMLGDINIINSAIKKKENFNRDTYLKQEYNKIA